MNFKKNLFAFGTLFVCLNPVYGTDFDHIAAILNLTDYKNPEENKKSLAFPFGKINYRTGYVFRNSSLSAQTHRYHAVVPKGQEHPQPQLINDLFLPTDFRLDPIPNMDFIHRLLYEVGFLKLETNTPRQQKSYQWKYTVNAINPWGLSEEQMDIMVNLLVRKLWSLGGEKEQLVDARQRVANYLFAAKFRERHEAKVPIYELDLQTVNDVKISPKVLLGEEFVTHDTNRMLEEYYPFDVLSVAEINKLKDGIYIKPRPETYLLTPNANAVVYVALFKDFFNKNIQSENFATYLKNVFFDTDDFFKDFPKDFSKDDFFQKSVEFLGSSLNVKSFRSLKPLDASAIVGPIKAKYGKKQNAEILEDLKTKYGMLINEFVRLATPLNPSKGEKNTDQRLLELFEDPEDKNAGFDSIEDYVQNVKEKFNGSNLDELILIINHFEDLIASVDIDETMRDDFITKITTFTGRMAHCETGQTGVINAVMQGILAQMDMPSQDQVGGSANPLLEALSKSIAEWKLDKFQRLVSPLVNLYESGPVVQRYQVALKDEVGLVVKKTEGRMGEANDFSGINEWDLYLPNEENKSPHVNIPLMKSLLWGIVFTPRNLEQLMKDHLVNVPHGELKSVLEEEQEKTRSELRLIDDVEKGTAKTVDSVLIEIKKFFGNCSEKIKGKKSAIEQSYQVLEQKIRTTDLKNITPLILWFRQEKGTWNLSEGEMDSIGESLREINSLIMYKLPKQKNPFIGNRNLVEEKRIRNRRLEEIATDLSKKTMNQTEIKVLSSTHVDLENIVTYFKGKLKPLDLLIKISEDGTRPQRIRDKAMGYLKNFFGDWFAPMRHSWKGNFRETAPYRLLVETGWIIDDNITKALKSKKDEFEESTREFLDQVDSIEREKGRHTNVFDAAEKEISAKYQRFLRNNADLIKSSKIRPAVLFIQDLQKDIKSQADAEKTIAVLTRGQGVGGFIPAATDHSEKATPEEERIMLGALQTSVNNLPVAENELASPAQDLLQSYITYKPQEKNFDYLYDMMSPLDPSIKGHLKTIWTKTNEYALQLDKEVNNGKPIYGYYNQSLEGLE